MPASTLAPTTSTAPIRSKSPKLYLDQYGNRFYAHTRKELKAQLPGHVSIMYIDKRDGGTLRIGYVIGQHWLTEYVRNDREVL